MSLQLVLASLTLLVAIAAAGDPYQPELPEKEEASTRKCYQCSYSPGKTIYAEKSVEKKILDKETGKYRIVLEKTMVPQQQIGGWDKCSGSFSQYDAASFGIDTWDCEHNCYVRVDKAGYLFRGCYRGEFGVDPNNLNDVQQVGNAQYKFCKDDLCNRFRMQHLFI